MKIIAAACIAGVLGAASAQPSSATEAVNYQEAALYSFCSNEDCSSGAYPKGPLIDIHGVLYGTASSGSLGGALFAFDPTADLETVIHTFCGSRCGDGSLPVAGVIYAGDVLYGTTPYGGKRNKSCFPHSFACGIVFSVNLNTGSETVLHKFCRDHECSNGAQLEDGLQPQGGLIDVAGVLYGTTSSGGAANRGTVFSINRKSGEERISIHSAATRIVVMETFLIADLFIPAGNYMEPRSAGQSG